MYWQRLWFGLAFIVNQDLQANTSKTRFTGGGKLDPRIQILQLATYMKKRQKETEIWIEKDGFKPSSQLDGKKNIYIYFRMAKN